jgi:transcriptional regulator with XRE-family HTH domain
MVKSWDVLRNRLIQSLTAHGAVSEFCRKIGVSRTAVDKWLKNQSSPNIENLDAIADALNSKPWDLIKPESEPLQKPHSLQDCLTAVNNAALGKSQSISPTKEEDPVMQEILSLLASLNESKRMHAIKFLRGLAGLPPSSSIRHKKTD